METKMTSQDVVSNFEEFFVSYEEFREMNGLSKMKNTKMNGFEICTSLSDKVGRIARQVKHYERKDPKPDWPDGLVSDITGVLVYLMFLITKYDIGDWEKGMSSELNSSIKQYSKPVKSGGCGCGCGCGCAGNCGENCACKTGGNSVQCVCKSKKTKKKSVKSKKKE